MAKIEGVGAIVLQAYDPATLARWYEDCFGIVTQLDPSGGFYHGEIVDTVDGHRLRFGIVPADRPLTAGGRATMINFRVGDYERFLIHLHKQGVTLDRALDESYGRFAYVSDPEGNPIEIFSEPRTGRSG